MEFRVARNSDCRIVNAGSGVRHGKQELKAFRHAVVDDFGNKLNIALMSGFLNRLNYPGKP